MSLVRVLAGLLKLPMDLDSCNCSHLQTYIGADAVINDSCIFLENYGKLQRQLCVFLCHIDTLVNGLSVKTT